MDRAFVLAPPTGDLDQRFAPLPLFLGGLCVPTFTVDAPPVTTLVPRWVCPETYFLFAMFTSLTLIRRR